jgi:deferrochelatase/peroxidase EfeB
MTQSFVTLIIPFRAPVAQVSAKIAELGNPAADRVATELDATGLIHFMSAHALPGAGTGPSQLVIELSIDGGIGRALEQLELRFGHRLRALLASAGIEAPERDLASFLARYHRPVGQGWFSTPGLNFSGTPGMSVARIKQEHALARLAGALLDRAPRRASAVEKLAFVRERLWQEHAAKWAFAEDTWPFRDAATPWTLATYFAALPAAVRTLFWPFVLVLALGLACAIGFADGWASFGIFTLTVVGALGFGVGAYALLRRREQADVPDDVLPGAQELAAILERENHGTQNHLLVLSERKPGPLRDFALRLAFFAIGQLAVRSFRPGFLSEIGTIHFARWIAVPGTSQLLFLSNYGGSWESYLEDFIRRAHQGLTGIWSNTRGFPRTRNLFNEGATDGARFKAWARRQQRPTAFWYSAYRDITTGRIRTNAEIRRGIASARTENEAARWLALFGAPSRPQRAIESEDVPALAFGGLPKLPFAKCFLLQLPDRDGAAKRWLAQIEPRASYGEDSADATSALMIGFSASGLKKVGLSDRHIATFPVAFQHGSDQRSRVLGDLGPDEPATWDWGGPNKPVDAALLLYAASEFELQRLEDALRALPDAPFVGCHEVRLRTVPAAGFQVEPFGFVDGVSQPIIRGSRRSLDPARGDQLIEPGEMILGYRDGLGFLPPTPVVEPGDDPENLLTETGFHVAEPAGTRPRNLGLNGTFLVVRQLEQHVDAFNAFLASAAGCPEVRESAPSGVPCEEWVAAKMVGRWRDGTSLVRHPHKPGTATGGQPDNDFLFGVEDPDGLRCPFGAHVRRANPRDSFEPGSTTQLSITDRHRILRVGRVYEPGNGRKDPGLLFMCVNADIERQFEFVQQSWVRAPGFHGLENEVDPIFARSGEAPAAMTVPTPHGPIALRGMADFVTLIGSGYFFLPGRRALRFLAR